MVTPSLHKFHVMTLKFAPELLVYNCESPSLHTDWHSKCIFMRDEPLIPPKVSVYVMFWRGEVLANQ